jgi:hypothetical protein
LFARSGFAPLAVSSGFGEQFLMLEARAQRAASTDAWPSAAELQQTTDQCDRFGAACAALRTEWHQVLGDLARHAGIAVLWGAGSKGVTFANLVASDATLLAGIVDINPSKHGKYVGGCGVPVLAPEDLSALRPDLVIVMNDNYAGEVAARLDLLGLSSEVRSVNLHSIGWHP